MTITDPAPMATKDIQTHWITRSGRVGGNATLQARFPYWSFTKTAIAICALKLVEAGHAHLDKQLPGYPFTLHQLLGHRSGLPDYATLDSYHAAVARGDTPWSRQQVYEAALAQGMRFAPSAGWAYSNIGYLLVREMIEDKTGKPLGEVIAEMICAPLGLENVRFWDSLEQSAALHWDAGAGYDPRWVYHGCLEGTAADAARLLHALFMGELVRPDTLEMMLVLHPLGGAIPGRPWLTCGYALGLMSGTAPEVGRAVGHSGSGPFCVNAVYHFPDLPDPVTVASFTDGQNEGVAETAAITAARACNPR